MLQKASFMDRLRYGWRLGKTSYGFIRQYPKTALFSWYSISLSALLFVCYIVFMISNLQNYQHSIASMPTKLKVVVAVVTFCWLLVTSIISTLFRVAVSFYTSAILLHAPVSCMQSIKHSFTRFFQITILAFLSVSISMLVNCLQNKNGKDSLGLRIATNLLGSTIRIAWNTLTYLVIPVIALENLTTFDSIKQSGMLIKKTWGEAVGAQANIGLIGITYLFVFYALFFIPFSGMFYLVKLHAVTFLPYMTHIAITAILLPFIACIALTSTASTIVQTALYNYSQNKPTGPFDHVLLQQAFTSSTQS